MVPAVTPWQSPSLVHAFGHESEQMPWQQSWPWLAQSDDEVHAFGQGVPVESPLETPASPTGLRHRPLIPAASAGSNVLTVVQQTGAWLVQSALVEQLLGHELEGSQIPWL